jgi:hypothetical protein
MLSNHTVSQGNGIFLQLTFTTPSMASFIANFDPLPSWLQGQNTPLQEDPTALP